MIPEAIPTIVIIPEGFFMMGSESGQENERPSHRVWVDSFGIGKFPVTNREYQVFVEETHASPPPFCSDTMFSQPEQPVVGISWYDATAYCTWLRERTGRPFRLPSEAEWERAARGNREGALYPWGDQPPCERPYAGYDRETGGPECVGANPPNDFGIFDISEGVHEWCSDYYDAGYYHYSPERNPQGPSFGQRRASRGGSWRHRIKFSRCAARSSLPPSFKYADYGFRVALSLAPQSRTNARLEHEPRSR
jgi:formylglycine-generating enzyme required for sulfatase activity